jgi:hypothetical protein
MPVADMTRAPNGRLKRLLAPRFWLQISAVFLVLAALNNWPAFTGDVPLPMGIILNFPPWRSDFPNLLPVDHAELGDVVTQTYPYRSFLHRAARHLTVPLWNPHVLLGVPFLANPIAAAFYPLNLLFYVLDPKTAWAISIALKPILAGIFTALLLRALGANRLGALAAGIAFSNSAFLVTWQGWVQADTALCTPLLFLAIDRLRRRSSLSSLALSGVAFALTALAGHPEVAIVISMAACIFALHRAFFLPDVTSCSWPNRLRFLGLLFAAAVLALGLSSIQVLPSLEWLQHLARSLSDTSLGKEALSPWSLLGLLSRDIRSNPNSVGIAVPSAASYVGVVTLLSLPFSILRRRRLADVFFFWALLLCALQVVYGFGPAYFLTTRLPVFRALPNYRLFSLLVDFSLAVLAGFGVSSLSRSHRVRWSTRREIAVLTGFALVTLLLACGSGFLWQAEIQGMGRPPTLLSGTASTMCLLFCGVLLFSSYLFRIAIRARSAAVGMLFAIDLTSFAHQAIPFVPRAWVYPPPAIYRALRAKLADHHYRVVTLNNAAPVNLEIIYDLYSPAGYEYVSRSAMQFFSSVAVVNSLGVTFDADKITGTTARILDLIAIRYLVTTTWNQSASQLSRQPDRFRPLLGDGRTIVFENLNALPRAFVVPILGVEIIEDDAKALARLTEDTFDPRHSVVVHEPVVLPDNWGAEIDRETPSVQVLGDTINEVFLSVQTKGPSLLVLSDNYDPGWTVSVDGKDEQLLRVDSILRGVVMRAGHHEARFVYRPRGARIGPLLSLASVVCTLMLLLDGRRRRATDRARRHGHRAAREGLRCPAGARLGSAPAGQARLLR